MEKRNLIFLLSIIPSLIAGAEYCYVLNRIFDNSSYTEKTLLEDIDKQLYEIMKTDEKKEQCPLNIIDDLVIPNITKVIESYIIEHYCDVEKCNSDKLISREKKENLISFKNLFFGYCLNNNNPLEPIIKKYWNSFEASSKNTIMTFITEIKKKTDPIIEKAKLADFLEESRKTGQIKETFSLLRMSSDKENELYAVLKVLAVVFETYHNNGSS